MVSRNDASPSDGDDKRLARIRGEQYPEHIKDSFVDFEKEKVNAATRATLELRKVERDLIIVNITSFPIHYK